MIAQDLIDTFVIYARLVIYPLLAYTLLIYAWGVLADKNREYAYVTTALSVVFLMLWGASITYFVTGDRNVMFDFSTIALLPVITVSIVIIWVNICRHCREQRMILKHAIESEKPHDG